jgi:hypothetical protein
MDSMNRPIPILTFFLVLGTIVACGLGPQSEALSAEERPESTIYHADPTHLWNRLHGALFVRVGHDDRVYGQDRLEPLLWPESKHLLEERSHKAAAAVLEEFLKGKGETRIDDPLKRAILQRDLWLVFNWVEGSHDTFEAPVPSPETVQASKQKLRKLLAAVIERLALTPDQIKNLPDNYALAVASGWFARQFDPAQPGQAYLPPDLFATDGPWVCLGRPDGLVAPEHLDHGGNNVFTNSTFLLFIRVPEGRAATLAYLKRLSSFDQPLYIKTADAYREYLPNPRLPQFPVGTELALVRRAMLISAPNVPTSTALVESIQLRTIREVPEMTIQTLNAGLGNRGDFERTRTRWQSFQEYRLSRSLLFAGKAGGLHALNSDERDFATGFGSHTSDEFEMHWRSGLSFPEGSMDAVKRQCFSCHGLPGVYSFNSFFHYRANMRPEKTLARPFSLKEMPLSEISEGTVKWKKETSHWTTLRDLMVE